MAILRVCSIYDSKAEAYMNPMFVPAIGIASRDFIDAFTSSDNKMSKHRSDFILYEVASFDTSNGSFESVVPPRLVFKGSDIGDNDA